MQIFFIPYTDVLVLAIYKLCKKSSISMVSGIIDIQPIWRTLGEEKARALPIFHAFTGTDSVGSQESAK